MPELPEVETMRRGVAGVVGSRIVQVEKVRCPKKPILINPSLSQFNRRVKGRIITDVGRLGKRVVLKLDSGDRIIIEPRMTGLLLITDPPSVEHLRFRIVLDDSRISELLYWDRRGLGRVLLWDQEQYLQKVQDGSLGPDALAVNAEQMRSILGGSQRPIKVALLDQAKIAGIGNLYASEILHLVQIHPETRCDQIRSRGWVRIHQAMLEVLHKAIEYEGSTLADGTYRNSLNRQGGYQNEHRVYDREHEICLSCGRQKIVRIVQAQRATFFCPKCQKVIGK
jgi:formamidopyrimidine-DNA glycosylase